MQTQTVWQLNRAEDLSGFLASSQNIALWRRISYPGSAALFDSVLPDLGDFRQVLQPDQVRHRLASQFPARFWRNPLALEWVDDVAGLVRAFCQELNAPHCQVQFDRQRPCVRYHADNVLMRLVCTYRGPGTLWLSEDNLNLAAAEAKGTKNEEIVLRPDDVQQTREWEVLVMKGKQANTTPLYHKSPSPRPGDPSSLVLKLDLVE
jgi:hypothetical protein